MNQNYRATGEYRRSAGSLYLTWVALLIAASVACAGGSSDGNLSAQQTEIVRGLIFEVNTKSLLDIESLTLVDDVGNTWIFGGGGFRGFTPSHLNEHRVLGDPITVTFHRKNGDLVIDKISD